ncbi:MAG: hypothetical protein RR869_08730 [Lachnospiraceae bacterium]
MIRQKKKEDKNIVELLPIERYDHELDCFVYNDGSLMNLYQINSKDLVSSNVDDIEMDCFKWAKFHKTYGMDIQILTMKYPCNTQKQQEFWQKKMETNRNPVFVPMLKNSLNELVFREKNTTSREFYLQVFFSKPEERKEGIDALQSTLEIGRYGLIRELTKEKKLQVLFKLNNKNSLIF